MKLLTAESFLYVYSYLMLIDFNIDAIGLRFMTFYILFSGAASVFSKFIAS